MTPKTENGSLFPRRALLSVSDKTGLIPLARALRNQGCELYASGGTKQALTAEGIEVLGLEQLSRSPEAFQGRMKTLSFPVFGGILSRRGDSSDEADREKLGIPLIDAVVVNFYPFEKAAPEISEEALTELIDIGGPALVRAAAKNRRDVAVVSSPAFYARWIQSLESGQGIPARLREDCAAQAWQDVARYDSVIAGRFGNRIGLRYGENPHQTARFEFSEALPPIAWDAPCTEASLSYNNILDFSAGFRLLSDLANWRPDAAHAVIVKHQNPCGVGTDLEGSARTALELAWSGDPVSAFGGIILLSKPLSDAASEFLENRFIEGIAAPGLSRENPELVRLTEKRKNLKALLLRDVAYQEQEMEISVPGGKLVQSADAFQLESLESQTGEAWSPSQQDLAQFGIFTAKSLKSNSIAIVECPAEDRFRVIGTGQGQPNRIEALAKLAGPRARAILEEEAKASAGGSEVFVKTRLAEAILISDAFFPFPDAIEAAHLAGVRRVVEPGGSVRDPEVIQRARDLGLQLAFTRRRHFRH